MPCARSSPIRRSGGHHRAWRESGVLAREIDRLPERQRVSRSQDAVAWVDGSGAGTEGPAHTSRNLVTPRVTPAKERENRHQPQDQVA